ncbi:hypothetical protein PAXRUDRAFT_28306 [Paxillus rubicundulus Ve08.2h10]|uniref:Uncharacterized protein n=1 Tax=Paxillus rubicundulus Ve08.2h10 TaxID=930991 RepID=A0A0D0D866_9AGAM|nr:hypothetical protein PAXRUDRAFT_28306 [Paxillus rubicundulus Ve08.2h10]
MPGGHPQLYKTPEERVLAARSYRAKYYDWIIQLATLIGEPKSPGGLLSWHSRVETPDSVMNVEASLKGIIRESSREFVESLCKEYINSGNYSNIYKAVSSMEELDKHVQAIRKLSSYSCDKHTTGIRDCICSVNRVLEDLLLHAMEGNDIAELHEQRAVGSLLDLQMHIYETLPYCISSNTCASMSPWTSKEQYEHLFKEVPAYRAVGGRKFNKLWPGLYQQWFQLWPERKVIFSHLLEGQPGLSEDNPLTEEQSKMLAGMIKNTYAMRHSNCSTGCGGMWVKLAGIGFEAGSSVNNRQAAIKEAFRNETPEVIEHVQKIRNVNQCRPTLQCILEHLRWKTSLHVGQNKYGNDFLEAYPKFDTEVIDAYAEFLLNVFGCPEAEGVMEKPETVGTEDESNNKSSKSDDEEDEEEEGGEDGEGDASSRPTSVPSYRADPLMSPASESDAVGLVQNFAMLTQNVTAPMQIFAMPMQNFIILMQNFVTLMQDFAMPMQNVTTPTQNLAPSMQNSTAPPLKILPRPYTQPHPHGGTPFLGARYWPTWDQPRFKFSSLMGSDMLNYNTFVPRLGSWNGSPHFPPLSLVSIPCSILVTTVHTKVYCNYLDDFTPSSSPTPSGSTPTPSPQLNSVPSPSMLPSNPHTPTPLGNMPMLPVPLCPPMEPGLINLPQTTTLNPVPDSSAGREGCSKCKDIPSQCAQCDNAIGNIGKENHTPIPAEKSAKPKKNLLKHSAPSDVKEGPTKKTFKCVTPLEAEDGSKKTKFCLGQGVWEGQNTLQEVLWRGQECRKGIAEILQRGCEMLQIFKRDC